MMWPNEYNPHGPDRSRFESIEDFERRCREDELHAEYERLRRQCENEPDETKEVSDER